MNAAAALFSTSLALHQLRSLHTDIHDAPPGTRYCSCMQCCFLRADSRVQYCVSGVCGMLKEGMVIGGKGWSARITASLPHALNCTSKLLHLCWQADWQCPHWICLALKSLQTRIFPVCALTRCAPFGSVPCNNKAMISTPSVYNLPWTEIAIISILLLLSCRWGNRQSSLWVCPLWQQCNRQRFPLWQQCYRYRSPLWQQCNRQRSLWIHSFWGQLCLRLSSPIRASLCLSQFQRHSCGRL